MTKMPTEQEVVEFGAEDLTTPNELRWWRRGLMRGVMWGIILGMAIMQMVVITFDKIYGP